MPVNTIPAFSENAQTVLCKRYLSQAGDAVHAECRRCGKYHETPVEMLQRVSFGVEEFYELMARLDFLPNSPTLFNAGLDNGGTFSACFKFDVKDNLLDPDGIMDTGFKAAAVQKWGGGVGFCFSALRAKGAPISSTHGRACGPVSVMKDLLQGIATMITQGGKREGAQMGILHCDHPDIEEFINCKSANPEVLNTFNISVAITDSFMEKAQREGTREHDLLWQMAHAAHKTGDPGCYFIDIAERHNPTPWMGQLTGTNPCGEVPLLNNEPCNLGSINLKNFAYPSQKLDVSTFGDLPLSRHTESGPRFDFGRLVEVTRVAVRFLDRILDENTFPHPKIDAVARQTRKLGLGVMGWADALAIMHIDYDSAEAVELGGQIMETIQQAAREESRIMAQEKGRAPAFDLGFINDLLDEQGKDMLVESPEFRHATRTCIAPTGTISILAGVSSGIEPHFALENSRTMGDGTALQEMVNVMEGWIPKTAHQVSWRLHLEHQAIFQKYTDLAVSKTINMPDNVSPEEIHQVYLMAWQYGCKGVTIYRDHSQVKQVLESTNGHKTNPIALEVKKNGVEDYTISNLVSGRKPMPEDRKGGTHHFQIGGEVDGYLTYGLYDDGKLGEIFITASRQGSTVDGLLDAVAMLTSFCLQHGVSLGYLVEKMRGRRFEPSGLTGKTDIPHATSILDYIFRWLGLHFTEKDYVASTGNNTTGMVCPDCGTMTVNQSNCDLCPQCGWEKC